jgi:5'-methylthioadenosine phosphorylase
VPRHGVGHRLLPSEIPYLANIWALKKLGCDYVLSISAGGSLNSEIAPGALVLVDQYIDRTQGRKRTFFGNGVVGHVPFADPVCGVLREGVAQAALDAGFEAVVPRGTYVCIEGPSFSTRAESRLFQSWGAHVVGMTNLPEARLAREAEISYASAVFITDWDCWKERDDVDVAAILEVLKQNVSHGHRLIRHLAKRFAKGLLPAVNPQQGVAQYAVVTDHQMIPQHRKEDLELIYAKYLA